MRFRWTFPAIALAVGVLTSSPALSRPPEDVGSLMRRAAQERKNGDYSAAAGTYREVLRLAPELFEAHLFLADTLRKHRLDDAAAERAEIRSYAERVGAKALLGSLEPTPAAV